MGSMQQGKRGNRRFTGSHITQKQRVQRVRVRLPRQNLRDSSLLPISETVRQRADVLIKNPACSFGQRISTGSSIAVPRLRQSELHSKRFIIGESGACRGSLLLRGRQMNLLMSLTQRHQVVASAQVLRKVVRLGAEGRD